MSDDQHDDDAEQDLRDRLRALDPAASLPAADPTGVARLLELTMTDEHTTESRTDHAHDRSRLTWLVAAAAAILIVGGVFLVVGQDDDASGPGTAADLPSETTPPVTTPTETQTETQTETVTELSAVPAPAAKCLPPESSPQVVSAQTTVVDAVAESVGGGLVTLRPTRFYAGEETDLVTVESPSEDMAALLSAVQFEEGKRYLVSATDGRVTLCGFSAEYSDSLAAVYATAFPG